MTQWYIENGPESDVVISSRVRLARNFESYPFSSKMEKEQEDKVLSKVKNAMMNVNGIINDISKDDKSIMRDVIFVDIKNLDVIEKQVLVEKHLVSPEFVESERINGLLISKDERISIMVNEEDHLRIQCLFPGMQIQNAWKLCDSIDSFIDSKLKFAFSKELGYLTCCPTNLGTGMRASVMLHLPALAITGYIRGMLDACSKLGVAVRGLYGENSEASGNMFQISNQVTLGLTEEEIITNITNIAFQVVEQERSLRKDLFKQNSFRLNDMVFRSYGIFSNARIISSDEGMKLLSDVRLGIDMGIITDITLETINEIMLLIQPANLQKLAGRLLNQDERDIMRAEVIRGKLAKA